MTMESARRACDTLCVVKTTVVVPPCPKKKIFIFLCVVNTTVMVPPMSEIIKSQCPRIFTI